MSCFTLEATDGAARAGVIRTAHGKIRTPAFMPVGTKGTVKTLLPEEVAGLGADVVLGNTYHLHLRPGEDVIEALGGLHAFTGWSGPILTDLRRHSQAILGPGVPDMSGRGVAVNDEQVRNLVPVGRRGTVEDIASAVCYLASEEAGYITGHSMVVDGGWRAK